MSKTPTDRIRSFDRPYEGAFDALDDPGRAGIEVNITFDGTPAR